MTLTHICASGVAQTRGLAVMSSPGSDAVLWPRCAHANVLSSWSKTVETSLKLETPFTLPATVSFSLRQR